MHAARSSVPSAAPGLGRTAKIIVSVVAIVAISGASAFALGQATAPERGAASAAPTTSAEKLQVTRPSDGPMRILFVGDSITYGLAAKKPEFGFRPLMLEALGADGPVEELRVNRAGADTGTVAGLLNAPTDVDLAIVELGTNDVVEQTDIARFRELYGALLDRIRTESPGVPLMCVGTWGSEGGRDGSDAYNTVIEKACDSRGGAFVSLYRLYSNEANRGPAGRDVFGGTSDRFHPNDRGYRAIADLLLSRLALG